MLTNAVVRRAICCSIVALLGWGLGAAGIAHGESITLSVTYNGTPYVNPTSSSTLYVYSAANPVLTLINGATGTTSNNLMEIGVLEQGGLRILNNSTFSSTRTTIGNQTGSFGMVTVSGGVWNNNGLNGLGINLGGNKGSGALVIENGGLVNNGTHSSSASVSAVAGSNSGSIGTITVSGTNSRFFNTKGLAIGASGSGTMVVTGGGKVTSSLSWIGSSSGSIGNVTISGLGSTWTDNSTIWITRSTGAGTLSVLDGASVTANQIVVADGSGSNARLIVDASTVTAVTGIVNQSGTGRISILNGSIVSSQIGRLGWNSSGNGTATVDNSIWNINGGMWVGGSGTGTLSILNGGKVSNTDALLGSEFSGPRNGTVTVSGTGSTWTIIGHLNMAGTSTQAGGTANMTISGGALVAVVGTTRMWSGATLTLAAGGNLTTGSFNRSQGVFNFTGGTLTVGGGTFTNASSDFTLAGAGTPTLVLAGASTYGIATLTIGGGIGQEGAFRSTGNWTTTNGAGGMIAINVNTGGTLTIDGTLAMQATTTLALRGGSVYAGSFNRSTGIFDFTDGTMTVNGGTYTNGAGTFTVDGTSSTSLPKFVLTGNATANGVNGIVVGQSNQGALSVTGGSDLNNAGDLSIATGGGSTGTVTVSGAGSTLTTASLYVGGNSSSAGGNGTLNIADNGLVYVGGTFKLYSGGTLNLTTGGKLDTLNLDTAAGQVNVATGGSLVTRGATVGNVGLSGGTLTNSGTISGDLAVSGGTWAGTGTVSGQVNASSGTFTIGNGSTLNAGGTSVTGSGTTVVVDGTLNGATQVSNGATAMGSGTYQSLSINDGGIASPGNSPETMTSLTTDWNSGGKYVWEINALATDGGVAGSNPGWDLWETGALTIGGPFTIELHSLMDSTNDGVLSNWDGSQTYSWRIATSSNGAFLSLGDLLIDDSFFAGFNSLGSGVFSLYADNGGADLYLNFAAVPEPGSLLLAGCAALGLAWRARRRVSGKENLE